MIERYRAGAITVDGKVYRKDVKIIHGEVKSDWWRKEGHRVDIEDVSDILSAEPRILVIGTGYGGNMRVTGALRSALSDHHIRLISENTHEAAEIFNTLDSMGEDVAAALHLTC